MGSLYFLLSMKSSDTIFTQETCIRVQYCITMSAKTLRGPKA